MSRASCGCLFFYLVLFLLSEKRRSWLLYAHRMNFSCTICKYTGDCATAIVGLLRIARQKAALLLQLYCGILQWIVSVKYIFSIQYCIFSVVIWLYRTQFCSEGGEMFVISQLSACSTIRSFRRDVNEGEEEERWKWVFCLSLWADSRFYKFISISMFAWVFSSFAGNW